MYYFIYIIYIYVILYIYIKRVIILKNVNLSKNLLLAVRIAGAISPWSQLCCVWQGQMQETQVN